MAACTSATAAASTSSMATLVGFPNANAIQKPWQLKPSSIKPHQSSTLITRCRLNTKPASDNSLSSCLSTKESVEMGRKRRVEMGIIGAMAAVSMMMGFTLDANATRIEYYATVSEPSCDLTFVPSGLGYCDVIPGSGPQAPYNELINVHYTARFGDETVFDSSYKRGSPLTMRIGVGKVIKGLDQGIFGGGGVPPMQVGGKRKLRIPPELAYGSEPAGCFSGDCNVPANATLLYEINFVNIYSGNRK